MSAHSLFAILGDVGRRMCINSNIRKGMQSVRGTLSRQLPECATKVKSFEEVLGNNVKRILHYDPIQGARELKDFYIQTL